MPLSKLLVAVISFFLLHRASGMECFNPSESRTRIFDSVVRYQGNKLPFSPVKPEWGGSNVEFNVSTIKNLTKNIFFSFDSQHIFRMKLSEKHIEQVDEGAFISLDCLQELLLDKNDITKLSKDVFQGLARLKYLDLSGNDIKKIPDLTFANLLELEKLNLANNKISIIEVLAFTNLKSLQYLNLEFNMILKVIPEVFQPLVNLTSLILASNKLEDIAPEKWGGLSRLEKLNLAGNRLDHFDPSYNFSFFALKTLNLSSNFLTQLNVEQIVRHLPKLSLIDLNGNPWFCDDLTVIIHKLMDSGIKFPGRNSSTVSEKKIACSDVPIILTKVSETTTTVTTVKNQIQTDRTYFDVIVDNKIKKNNEKIMSSLHYVQHLMIFLFVLVLIFIVFEIAMRTNCCSALINRIRGGNEVYFDNSNVENFRLLHR